MDKDITENKTEQDINKHLPENTLAVFEINDETCYMTEIKRVSIKEYESLFATDKQIKKGNYFIYFEVIKGYYPIMYDKVAYYIHVIPKENYYQFRRQTVCISPFENGTVELGGEPNTTWYPDGNSKSDNTLSAKVFEYYRKEL